MAVFIAYFIAVLFLGALLCRGKQRDKKIRAYVILIGIALFLISALRDEKVGIDTSRYIDTFLRISVYGFGDALSIGKDPGFSFFLKLLSFISSDPRFFLAICAAIFAFSVSVFIFRYSNEPVLSFFSLMPLGFFYFSMTGIRQALAISVLLFAYPYILKRKPIHFFLLVLLAASFHLTALVFSLAYLASVIKVSRKSGIALLAIIGLAYVFRYDLVEITLRYSGNRVWSQYEINDIGRGWTTTAMYLAILAVGLLFRKSVLKKDPNSYLIYDLVGLGVIFQMMAPIISEFFRISVYFAIFLIIFLPNIVIEMPGKQLRLMAYIAAVVLLSVLYFAYTYRGAGVYPYHFFWDV